MVQFLPEMVRFLPEMVQFLHKRYKFPPKWAEFLPEITLPRMHWGRNSTLVEEYIPLHVFMSVYLRYSSAAY